MGTTAPDPTMASDQRGGDPAAVLTATGTAKPSTTGRARMPRVETGATCPPARCGGQEELQRATAGRGQDPQRAHRRPQCY